MGKQMYFKGKHVIITGSIYVHINDWPRLIEDMGLENDKVLFADDVIRFLIKNEPHYIMPHLDCKYQHWGLTLK